MNDLEDRLRTGLRDLADAVPSSAQARADFERRLARRPSRRPVLAAAAVAVVIAAVAIPVALNQGDEPAPHIATTGTASPSSTRSDQLDAHTRILGSFIEDGVTKQATLAIAPGSAGEEWCVDEVVPVGATVRRPNDCSPLPTWPMYEPPGTLVLTHTVFGGTTATTLYSGPLPRLMLFVTAPQVTSLEVDDGAGEPVPVHQVIARPGATFYLAEFPDTPAGFGYTAKDAAGRVLVTAIT